MSAALLLLATGGRITVPPPPEPFAVTAAPDGAWSWFGDPRAVHHNGYTYIGYVDTSGNICVRVLPDGSETVGSEIVLRAALDIDDHCNPSFLVRASDHKLMAWYAGHDPQDNSARMRVSTTSLDTDPTLTDGFATEVNLDSQIGATTYNYPVPFQLSNGDIHLFYRAGAAPGGDWIRTVSTDDGATWSVHVGYYLDTTGYVCIHQAGDRLHFAVTNDSPNIGTTSLGHFYWEDGSYYETDGTLISASLPLNYTHSTVVYDTSNTWVWDVATDADGHPVIVHPRWETEFTDVRYLYSRWDGAAWVTTEFAAGGPGIDTTGVYSGGIALDPADPNVVWASRQSAGEWEIFRYVTSDDGATFAGTAVTSGSTVKNIRPYVAGDLVLWMVGAYTGYTAYNTGIHGIRNS